MLFKFGDIESPPRSDDVWETETGFTFVGHCISFGHITVFITIYTKAHWPSGLKT